MKGEYCMGICDFSDEEQLEKYYDANRDQLDRRKF